MKQMIVDDVFRNGKLIKSYVANGVQCITRTYSNFRSMNNRVKLKSYTGCTIDPRWLDFDGFAAWCVNQVGYGISGYSLDKDFLAEGNKGYSPDWCVLIPRELNSFVQKPESRSLPVGVTPVANGKYRATTCVDNKPVHIGLYSTPEEAHNAYATAKNAEARLWAKRLRAGEYAVDSRVIAALEGFTA